MSRPEIEAKSVPPFRFWKNLLISVNFRSCLAAFLALTGLISAGCVRGKAIHPTGLRCEYRVNPLGIDSEHPRLSWTLESEERGQRQIAYRILAADSLEGLAQEEGHLWDSGRVESSESIHIEYAGLRLQSGQRCFWKVRAWDRAGRPSRWSKPAFWEAALLRSGDWKGIWISDGRPLPERDVDFFREDPAPLFRKTFSVDGKISRARLYISGLGYYEARLNGSRVGDHVLDPGWTDYRDRILYGVYDVTGLLEEGENCLGVTLGNGWYNSLPLRMWGRLNLREHLPTGRPCLIAQLEIRFADGTSWTLTSDTSWKVGEGPIRRNNIYLGEVYDSRREVPGWDRPGLEDADWENAVEAPHPGGRMEAQPQPPIKVRDAIKPIAVTHPHPGVFIYDLGENFAGWVRMRVRAPSGTEIRLRYGELLYPDGSLNPMTSVAGQIKGKRRDGTLIGGPGSPEIAEQRDIYIAKGSGDEVYTPTFTFHSFRYVEVSGLPDAPEPEDLTGLRLHADVAEAGSFTCSDPFFNHVQDMTRRTFLSNIFSVQSDCPHRERFGYGGDLVVTSQAFMLNFDMAGFYAKAVRDWHDAAFPDGMLTDTAPYVGIQYCGVAWAMVHPWLQVQLYKYYGDRRLLEEQYPTSRRWLDLVRAQNPGHIISDGLSDHEGLEPAPAPAMVTPLYFESARLLSRMAAVLDLAEDERRYLGLASDIRRAYLQDFLDAGSGRVAPHTQAAQCYALALGLLPEQERDAALEVLLQKIREEHDGHLSTGIYGTRFLLEVLSQAGIVDAAAEIIRKRTFPGWGFMLENGATTLWEHWAFSDNTFSHNHPMFGSISEWFIKWLAGIQPHPEAVGFDRIRIRPHPVPGVDWSESEYDSVRGKIVVRWELKDDEFRIRISIPTNTTAEIYLPASDVSSVKEGGRPAASVPGLRFRGWEDGCAVFAAESGEYVFTSTVSSAQYKTWSFPSSMMR